MQFFISNRSVVVFFPQFAAVAQQPSHRKSLNKKITHRQRDGKTDGQAERHSDTERSRGA